MTDPDIMALATRLYVRLRHCTGRSTDALWMAQNADYGHEVVRLAQASGDDELAQLADRFAERVLGLRPAPVRVAPAAAAEPPNGEPAPALLSGKYTGALR